MIISCRHYVDGLGSRTSCTADATHYLHDEDGRRIGVYCEKHAREIVDEYREKLGWNWAMEPIPEEELWLRH